jgi:putative transposase
MYKAHIIKLYPTKSQEILFKKSCGVARYSYNWALSTWEEMYENGGNPSAYTLIKIQNNLKKTEWPFFTEVGKSAPQYAIHNLQKAYKRFFNKTSKYPKFKKKGQKDSFVAVENNIVFKQENYKIHIPRIGKVKCAENLRFKGKVNKVTIKRVANLWFAVISIDVQEETSLVSENQTTIGVDLGIKTMLVLSNGKTFENPKALKSNLKKLKQYQRSLSRKQKGSNNRRKQQVKVARLYYKISCIRNNAIHNATTYIVKNFDKIIIEDLNVSGMNKNKNLSKSLIDVSFGEIRRQLEYKSQWLGKELIIADRFFPSSKLCSSCGNKKKTLKLSERTYICENCGLVIDRDLNAAINLANYCPTQKVCECKVSGELSSIVGKQFSSSKKEKIDLLII